MIKAIIFDFGGVILRTGSREPRHHWDRRLGLEPGTVEHVVFNSEEGRAAQRGEKTEAAHWAWLKQHFALDNESAHHFQRDFWAGDKLDDELIGLIRDLSATYRTALISNAMDDLRRSLSESYGIGDLFETVVISSEFGVMKPDPSIYEHCLNLLGVAAAEAVFVDDFSDNIAGAEAIGMHGVHYTSAMTCYDLKQQLRRLGVTVAVTTNGSD